jgi:hypothetical protein
VFIPWPRSRATQWWLPLCCAARPLRTSKIPLCLRGAIGLTRWASAQLVERQQRRRVTVLADGCLYLHYCGGAKLQAQGFGLQGAMPVQCVGSTPALAAARCLCIMIAPFLFPAPPTPPTSAPHFTATDDPMGIFSMRRCASPPPPTPPTST